jgi:voltage-gated potassium channel Kch
VKPATREPPRASRRDAFRLRHLWAPDRYGALLLLIVAAIVSFGLLGDQRWGRSASLVLVGAMVALALKVAALPGRWVLALAWPIAIALLGAVSSGLEPLDRLSRLAYESALVLLLLTAPIAIAVRVARQPRIGVTTVVGAVCVYLLVGFVFAGLYALVATAASAPFFASGTAATGLDDLYFSYVTLTTVGYGDLTPGGDLGRMLAVTEALMGQVYLVTVVALLVANVGRERSRPG